MVNQWSTTLVALIAVLPLLVGCGSSKGPANNGLSEAELAKVMEADKEAAAKAPAPEVTAKKLIESLTADPAAGASASKAIFARPQIVTGVVVDRSPEGSGTPFLTLDGGSQDDKAHKLKFNFDQGRKEDIAAVKVGDNVRLIGSSDGEIKEGTLEFKECVYYPQGPAMPAGSGGPPPIPQSK